MRWPNRCAAPSTLDPGRKTQTFLQLALPANVGIKSTMAIPVIEEKDFEREVLRNEQPVLVDFYADWCGPCKTMEPEVVALAHELNGKAKVVKVNIDRSKVLAQRLRIQSVPTTMVFAGGRIAAAEAGALRRDQLRQMIEPFLPRAEGALRAAEVAQLLAQRQIALVDTRDPPVFARMHLPGAVNIPLADIGTRLAELHMLPAEPVLYCRGGEQCKELAARLAAEGTPVAFLEGGALAWEAEGLPVERPD
jgi:thioredoxin